jgi:hypothetical protein
MHKRRGGSASSLGCTEGGDPRQLHPASGDTLRRRRQASCDTPFQPQLFSCTTPEILPNIDGTAIGRILVKLAGMDVMNRLVFGFGCAATVFIVNLPATALAQGCAAVTVRATGEADVIAKPPVGSPDLGALDYWHAMPGDAWSHNRIAGPGAMSAYSCPSIAVRSTGEALVVDRDANNNLIYYHATPGSTWSMDQIDGPGTMTIPGSPSTRSAAIAVRANDEADIVTAGPNGEVMYYFQLAPSAKFQSSTIAGPKTTWGMTNHSIAVRSDGEADVVTLSRNNDLLYFFATPGSPWHGPTTIVPNGTLYQSPAIGVRSSGEAYVVAENLNGGLTGYHATPGSSWSADPISGTQTINSLPSLAVRSTGEIDVVANGYFGSLYYYWQLQSGAPWNSIAIAGPNSNVVSAPAIAVRSNGEADVVAIQSPYNVTYWHAMPGQPWSSPTTLPK